MKKKALTRWRGNFFTGLAVLLPTVITLAIIKWLFGTIASFTDSLLFFLPTAWTHADGGKGPVIWYWSLVAFAVAILLVTLVGLLTRYYIGKQILTWLDGVMLRVPLLNKIYGTIKQINNAFVAGGTNSFKTVVRVEFPSPGTYSIGFVTSEVHDEVSRSREKVVSVFVPTTPMPTAGFLILVPEDKVVKLDMSVADAIKYIVSLGSLSTDLVPAETPKRQLRQEGEKQS